MTFTRRCFLGYLSLAALTAWTSALPAGAETAAATSLPRSTPEAEGVPSSAIVGFIDAIEKAKHEMHSFMMLRHGQVIAESWAAPYAPELNHTMYSMSKSFTSTAVGFAVSEGKLSVEDKVISFFPDDLPAKISGNLAALRVKDLLTMSVGNEKEPTGAVVKEENWVRAFLAQPITHQPGTVLMYNSAATYMCSAIVQKVTGQKIIDYLTPRLFEPLGITGMTWEECPRGINTGGWGLSIRTEGLAKFGQLYLQKGQWQGKQILPAKWIEEATGKHIQQPQTFKAGRPAENNDWQQGYGYQFWRCQNGGFRGDGAFGQFTIVLPAQDAVIVMTEETKDMQGVLDLVWQHLLPACKETSLPADEASLNKLLQRSKTLKITRPNGEATSPTSVRITGREFTLPSNSLGLTKLSFAFDGSTCTFTAHADQTEHIIHHGLRSWKVGETQMPGTPPRLISGGKPKTQPTSKVAASATWKDAGTLELTWRYIETPHRDTVTCKFEGDTLTVAFLNSLAELAGKKKDDRPTLTGHLITP
ncbi:MAG TPA: serine hydrolase [Prosthecobacter sp.]|nr:serine hydrolase [Prosthecobacter sp.]